MVDEIFNLLMIFFKNDAVKASLWLKTPNPLLGGVTPGSLIVNSKSKRLLKFIKNQLSENERNNKND